ncbi:MAG: right-handed parallel beta-helix repeat-containing protein [Myxococcales bacterium]|nr:right-handed parallel beta-helix repeat-containing protein [Myxococcales bacterium]
MQSGSRVKVVALLLALATCAGDRIDAAGAATGNRGDVAASAPRCDVPPGAIRIAPGTPVQEVVDRHPPGTSFVLGRGVHLRASVSPRDGDRFFGERDADCRRLAVMRGARRLTEFSREGAHYFAHHVSREDEINGRCRSDAPRCDRVEDLFVDDRLLRHVSRLEDVEPGKWHFDYESSRVYVAFDPTGRRVEISEARFAFASETARNVVVEGLVIEKYANPAQMGAVGERGPGPGWRIVDNEIRWNHGAGVTVTDGGAIRRNAIHHNGQLGATADGVGVVVEGNEIAWNNTGGTEASWEAGGAKFAETRALTIRDNCVHHNDGPGLWVDVDARDTRFIANTVFENEGEGIFVEISREALIRNNRVGRNGRSGRWLYGANILISGSRDTRTIGNLVEVAPNYGHGIVVIWQEREDAHAPRNHEIAENDVTFLGTAGRQGAATDFDAGTAALAASLVLRNNRYHMSDPNTARFEWNDRVLPFSDLQTLGREMGSSADTETRPEAWRCP